MADAPDLESGVFDVEVQVLSPAPNSRKPNPKPIGEVLIFLSVYAYMSSQSTVFCITP